MAKILNFGSLNIDKVYTLDHIVNEGETIPAISYNEGMGGKGLNQSIALKRAGADFIHAGFVGEDDGDILLDYMAENEINFLVEKVSGNSGHAIIQVDKDANNSIIVEAGANKKIDKSYIDQVLAEFEEGDYILLQNEISNLPYIVDLASKRKMRIFLNPSPVDQTIKTIDFNKIDTLILNETEACDLSGCESSDKIINYFRDKYKDLRLLLTLGKNGGIYSSKDTKIKFASFKTKAIDTTGAGDTFLGYFLASISKGEDVEKSLKLASLAASLACSKKGAAISIPSLKKVEAYAKDNNVELG